MSAPRIAGRTFTILVLFLLVVVIVLIIFVYATGLVNIAGRGSDNVGISGTFALNPSNTSEGTLAFSISNVGKSSITNVTFSCPPADFASANCNNLTLSNSAGVISAQNPITNKAYAGGTAVVALAPGFHVTPGEIVTVAVQVTFSDGSLKTYPYGLPTQE